MPYFLVEDFSQGLDLRKSPISAPPGSLRTLTNAFINPGGEIEKRMTVTSVGSVPANTKGVGFHNGEVVVFGTATSQPTLTGAIKYRRLVHTNTSLGLSKVLDATSFGPDLYVIARMADNTVAHFYVTPSGCTHLTTQSGSNAKTHRQKVFVTDGRNLRFSAIGDGDNFAGTGSGLIDTATTDGGASDLVGMEAYYSSLAVFSRLSIQIWSMDVDPAQNVQVQSLHNIGLVGPHAVAGYGSGDLLFLSHTGIRSLRARDSSNAAMLADLGSPIDALIQSKRSLLTDAAAEDIYATVDPLSGQYWLIWGQQVHVLSYYPNSKISAWSTYVLPLSMDAITLANSRIVMRSGNEVFVYGTVPPSGVPWAPNAPTGRATDNYDASVVEVVTPFIDLNKPATEKRWKGVDVGCEGTWSVEVCMTPEYPDLWTHIATVSGSTFHLRQIGFDATSTHLAFRLRSLGTGPARIAKIGVHFSGEGFAE